MVIGVDGRRLTADDGGETSPPCRLRRERRKAIYDSQVTLALRPLETDIYKAAFTPGQQHVAWCKRGFSRIFRFFLTRKRPQTLMTRTSTVHKFCP